MWKAHQENKSIYLLDSRIVDFVFECGTLFSKTRHDQYSNYTCNIHNISTQLLGFRILYQEQSTKTHKYCVNYSEQSTISLNRGNNAKNIVLYPVIQCKAHDLSQLLVVPHGYDIFCENIQNLGYESEAILKSMGLCPD